VIGGQRLEPSQFPVPHWLQQFPPRSATGIIVPDHSYFVSTEYGVNVHGHAAVTDQAISNACIARTSDIRGRVFLQWWPLSKRRFMEQ